MANSLGKPTILIDTDIDVFVRIESITFAWIRATNLQMG